MHRPELQLQMGTAAYKFIFPRLHDDAITVLVFLLISISYFPNVTVSIFFHLPSKYPALCLLPGITVSTASSLSKQQSFEHSSCRPPATLCRRENLFCALIYSIYMSNTLIVR